MNQLKRLLLFFISAIALIFWLQQPTIVLATDERAIQTIEQEAQQLYQQNQYPEAIALIKTAIKQYQKQDDRVGMAIATRNLALIYQKLGAWEQAETTLARGTKIIDSIDSEPEKSQLLAQILEVKGQVELSLGRSQNALATWRQATSVYEKQGNITGLTQGKIYQAHALQALGLYSQSLTTLTATNQQLENQPDSLIKAQALLNLGNVLNRVG
ncbi:MAG: tetratricopeptide repeat protein, partial [Pleurocapsa sp. MO_226.B13]|nr:tetratricopeptide repeat protein [Pleurocapsa sp. MO_226.B13]